MDCMLCFLLFVIMPVYIFVARFLFLERHSASISWRGRPRTIEDLEERERVEHELAEALRKHPWFGWIPFVTWTIVVGAWIVWAAYSRLEGK